MTAIGIDLGTTNSAVAAYDPAAKRASILSNKQAERLTPSVVGLVKGKLEVGNRVLQFARKDPENTIRSVKRLMGRDFADKMVGEARERLSYLIVPGPGEDPRAHVMLNAQRCTPAEVSAMILDSLKIGAAERLGEMPTHAVITVPAYFNQAQRAATREAGEQAGLVVKRIIDEPTAAAIAYGVDLPVGDRRRILVYDLGGGTFDISILNTTKGSDGRSHFQTLHFTGDTWLGGDDFDQVIIDRIIDWIKRETGQDPTTATGQDPTALARFKFLAKEHAEKAKRELSDSEEADITIPALKVGDGVVIDVDMQVTRREFESAIAPLVNKTIDLVRSELEKQNISRDAISDVLLVGGSTLTPMVYQAVEDFFGTAKVRRNVDPMECVALGAGILAGTLLGVECPDKECKAVNDESLTECEKCGTSLVAARSVGETQVYDVTGMAMGIAAVHGNHADTYVPIISRDHPYPMTQPARRSFEATDGRKIRVPVFEGDDPIASRNSEVGIIEFELPEEIDIHTRVEVEFMYNRNRELLVTISVPGTTITHHQKLRTDAHRSTTPDQLEPGQEEEDESAPREELVFVVEIAERFLRTYEQFLDTAQAIKIHGDLERAKQILVFSDPEACRRMTDVLQSDLVGSGLASQLFLAERAADRATPDDAQKINRAITELQKSYHDGRTEAVTGQAQLLKMMVAQVRREDDVAAIGDAEEFDGLLRWLDK